jgi:aromatic ring-opening dioxygenase catalytic subunit (LigB family)
MATTVLGIGTSHSPLLAIEPTLWQQRSADDYRKTELFLTDGRVVSYAELETEVEARYAAEATPENFEKQALKAGQALDQLAHAIERAQLDALVVIGDDQNELFSTAHTPAIAVFNGAELLTHPKNEVAPDLPQWYREANHGYKMDAVYSHPADPALAGAIIDGLIAAHVDVAVAGEVLDPHAAGFGHAYGFVIDRLVGDRKTPIVPIMLNTYFPPNVPRPARCYEVGQAIGQAIAGFNSDARVGIVASGGLTHFAVDADLDRTVIGALETGDAKTLSQIAPEALRSGNSEILNWIMAAGALAHLKVVTSEYIPVRRTPAGTGIGLAFLVWQ